MEKFRLAYNPFKVEMALWVEKNGAWIPVSEESGLKHIAKKRMQRWINPSVDSPDKWCFFDELREASGEDEIDILFCGTTEDYTDLKIASEEYIRWNTDVTIEVHESIHTAKNSSQQKIKYLSELMKSAKTSGFQHLLPDHIWKYLNTCTEYASSTGALIDFLDWQNKKDIIFAPGAWKMICLSLPLADLHKRKTKESFRSFAKSFETLEDRAFERERFLLICQYEEGDDNSLSKYSADIERLLLENGIQDIPYLFLDKDDFLQIEDIGLSSASEQLQTVQETIGLFTDRYAQQYHLRKMYDVLIKMLTDYGFVEGAKLYRQVESDIRSSNPYACDNEIKDAYNWMTELLSNINSLLDVNMQEEQLEKEG